MMLSFWSLLNVLEQLQLDDNTLGITGPNFTKLTRMVRIIILMQFEGLDAESKPLISDGLGNQAF